MGNSSSKSDNSTKYELIEQVAIDYATTLNLENIGLLSKPSEKYKNSCSNLTFVSSELLRKSLKPVEIKLLEARVKNGVDLSTNTIVSFSAQDLENAKILSEEGITTACNTISSFYIKISHLYAAIVRVLNPSVTYSIGSSTNTVDLLDALSDKEKLPKDIKIHDTTLSLCSKRVTYLNPQGDDERMDNLEMLSNGRLFSLASKKVCNINLKSDGSKKTTLGDEYGIYELEQLYYDKDQYGRLSVPTKDSPKYNDYINTLFNLYTTFTLRKRNKDSSGNEDSDVSTFNSKYQSEKLAELLSKNITKFSEIPLKDYTVLCSSDDIMEDSEKYRDDIVTTSYNKATTSSSTSHSDELLAKEYIQNIKDMHEEKEKQIQEILNILNEIFKKDSSGSIIINPALSLDNEVSLDKLIEKTREMIKNLYINCELKYLAGIEKYKQIREYIITSQRELVSNPTIETDEEELNPSII